LNKMAKRKKKKKVTRRTTKSDSVHVMVVSPIESRKSILRETISIVDLLQRYKVVKKIREAKEDELSNFRKKLGSITRLVKLIRLKEMPLEMEELKKVRSVNNKLVFAKQRALKPLGVAKPKSKEKALPKDPLDAQMEALRRKLSSL